MRETARLQAAIDILAAVEVDLAGGAATADRRIQSWARGARYAGSKDRRAVSDIVYAALRRRGGSLFACEAWDLPSEQRARLLAAAALVQNGADLTSLFAGDRHGPEPLNASEERRLAQADFTSDAAMRANFPAAHLAELERSVSAPLAEIERLAQRASADLRVNRLKASVAEGLQALKAEGVDAAPAPLSPRGARLVGAPSLAQSTAYLSGLVEPQDAASQATALLAQAAAGETVLDYCAGGGGKSLAMAAEMGVDGCIFAYDVEPRRMVDAPARAARAGAKIECLAQSDLSRLRGAADLVFVDAPCSGSGAWARNPDAKWATTLERIHALRRAQLDALSAAAAFVRPGGRLVYVTCSIFAAENDDQRSAFLAAHPAFEAMSMDEAWEAAELEAAPPDGPSRAAGAALIAPSSFGTDGFYVALMRRSAR